MPWITSRCRPRKDATVIHMDSDPLKSRMAMFYIDSALRLQTDPVRSIQNLTSYLNVKFAEALASDTHKRRRDQLVKAHQARLSKIALDAQPLNDGSITPAYLMNRLRSTCPADTTWVVEAVTNSVIAADQIQAKTPGSWINCGGGGLGWSGGGALGVKLAMDL